MGRCETTQFGVLEYEDAAVVHFPFGLPAFESETRFLLIEQAETAPVVFLQSLRTPKLLFLAMPARYIDAAYRLDLSAGERAALGLAAEGDPEEGRDLVSLAILTVKPGEPLTANLLAPVVIASGTRRALQVLQPDAGYSVEHRLGGAELAACS